MGGGNTHGHIYKEHPGVTDTSQAGAVEAEGSPVPVRRTWEGNVAAGHWKQPRKETQAQKMKGLKCGAGRGVQRLWGKL